MSDIPKRLADLSQKIQATNVIADKYITLVSTVKERVKMLNDTMASINTAFKDTDLDGNIKKLFEKLNSQVTELQSLTPSQ